MKPKEVLEVLDTPGALLHRNNTNPTPFCPLAFLYHLAWPCLSTDPPLV